MRMLTLFLAGLVTMGCDSADTASQADQPKVDTADPSSVDAAAGGTTPEADADAAATETAPTGAAVDLAAYVGKYPFDKVSDLAFFDQPAVKSAIAAAIPDTTILGWVTGGNGGPSAPIEMKSGKIASWACEAHNCGDHQWTVLIDSAGKAAEICYQDAGAMPGKTRWYRAGSAPETREGTCQL
ncbi:hypothetical protein [Sphingosinicella soli]|uniref:Inhibitor of vertebrate lysozyme (Ivy) n=1 Tax=Sphingosinicella soli TaxID=333708 RepID=A0A7W7F7H8_9SPHN|nr:hypothetical protein [Sphingosinicella soli]MBB4633695.1 hypothetical protein [Sphingosinicella soli]